MHQVKVERFLEDFLNELEAHSVAIFAGAGLSVHAGFVDWKQLLAPLATDLNLDIEKEEDLVSLAQYHVTTHGNNRSDLSQRILNEFAQTQAKQTDNHRILTRLPIHTYWTTNYDNLIEHALSQAGKVVDVKHDVSQLPHSVRNRDAVVYKMHGDVAHPQTAILCKEDYEQYHVSHAPFLTALAGDLISKTFLFLGFSFADPNLHYVLSRLRIQYGQHQRRHYCILKRESGRSGDMPGDLEYRKTKQALFVHDLLRYAIRTVLVDDYDEITDILRRLERMYKQRTVFVSGAADDYGPNWPPDDALRFVRDLGKALIENGHRIVSGLGLGIGAAIIDGALEQIYHVQKQSLKDQLILRPFPQAASARAMWDQYRQDMLSYAGVALFLFGNKRDAHDVLVHSDGMEREFEIAQQNGLLLLPLGATGSVAKRLWKTVHADLKTFYPNATPQFLEALCLLGDESQPITSYLPIVLEALNEGLSMQ